MNMTPEEKLRQYIREILQKELDEISTSAGAGPYSTPLAFRGNKNKNVAKMKHTATQMGYKLTPNGQRDLNRQADELKEDVQSEQLSKPHDYSKVAGKKGEQKKPGETWKTRTGSIGAKNMKGVIRYFPSGDTKMADLFAKSSMDARGATTSLLPDRPRQWPVGKSGPASTQAASDKKLEENKYSEYKNDTSATPHKKIARAISELNRSLNEAERVLNMNTRLKNESGIASEQLWKRTQQGLIKLESKLITIAGKIRELRGN